MRQKVKHAVIREQNVVFTVVQVRDSIAVTEAESLPLINNLTNWYRCPVVLIGSRSGRLCGRGDLVNFLASLKPSQIPWREEMVDYNKPNSRPEPVAGSR